MFKCTLVSATDRREEQGLTGLFVQTVTGERGFLPGHVPLIARLKANSLVRLKTGQGQKYYTVGADAFLQFGQNTAVILARSFAETPGV
ncbi:MAG: hypothetical protein LBQ83_05235 [Candidatus Margulisbacteria bacterium]|jgi:F0F1-type ATP synthase epsilon subunit|nr:hypothetical protein [Candidatus Margulisiibacteriota bacterium]